MRCCKTRRAFPYDIHSILVPRLFADGAGGECRKKSGEIRSEYARRVGHAKLL